MGDTPSTAENVISEKVLTNTVVQVDYYICKPTFQTNRGLLQYLNTCRRKQAANATNVVNDEEVDDISRANGDGELSTGTDLLHWNNGYISIKDVNHAYEKIVYWRKNLFMVPSGAAGKKFINETTKMLNFWTDNSPLNLIAHKALHVPALLLQKPSKTSKSKDNLAALSKCLELWDDGKISELLYESIAIQERLSNGNDEMNIAKISSKFKDLMKKR